MARLSITSVIPREMLAATGRNLLLNGIFLRLLDLSAHAMAPISDSPIVTYTDTGHAVPGLWDHNPPF